MAWLDKYTFPAEQKFTDEAYAQEVSSFFIDQLLRNGITTACVWSTIHKSSVNAFFKESEKRNLRMITGKVMMNQNCPSFLKEDPEKSAKESEELLNHWHNKGRLSYSLSPRFAVTSMPKQLGLAGELAKQYPTVYIQTHLAENLAEVAFVQRSYPSHRSYLDVYDDSGLVRPRSIFAHSILIDERDRNILSDSQACIATCPSANLFLGSGLFNWQKAKEKSLNLALGTDIGAGTGFSMLSL